MRPIVWGALFGILIGGLLVGCSQKTPANTPEAVASAFAEAMASGNTLAAAKLWEYVREARRAQPDWEEIPPGQRSQIVTRLQSAKADELSSYTNLFADKMTIGLTQASSANASVELEGGPQGSILVYLVRSEGKWGVVGFQRSTP